MVCDISTCPQGQDLAKLDAGPQVAWLPPLLSCQAPKRNVVGLEVIGRKGRIGVGQLCSHWEDAQIILELAVVTGKVTE